MKHDINARHYFFELFQVPDIAQDKLKIRIIFVFAGEILEIFPGASPGSGEVIKNRYPVPLREVMLNQITANKSRSADYQYFTYCPAPFLEAT